MEIYLEEVKSQPSENYNEHFEFISKIGSGSFGTVYHAIYLKNNKHVAVKVLNKDKAKKDINKLKKEITIFQELKHPNIVEFYEYIETKTKIFIVMEYIREGTLKSFINERKEKG